MNNKSSNRRRDEPTSASESSSESYSSSDNSGYTSDESSPRRNVKKKKKATTSQKNNNNNIYSDEDDTSHAATSIAESHRYDDEDLDDDEKNKENPAQLEAIPEGEEEEERYLQAEKNRKRLQDMHVNNRLSQLQAKTQNFNPNKYSQNRNTNTRKPMHSYHGNSPEPAFEDNEECLLREAQKNSTTASTYNRTVVPKGRSLSTDATTPTSGSRQNWRKPRKSFGDNQLRTLPPNPAVSNNKKSTPDPKVDTNTIVNSVGVRALVNRIQTQTDVVEDTNDPYLATKFEYARNKTFGRNGSREGNLSEENNLDAENDDPLFDPTTVTRRAGMTQARDGRAYLSRKNSFNNTKQAKESGRMTEHEKDKKPLEPRNSGERPKVATVQRSTSRVKQIAMSLHERETTVRKTEAMIANHQPLADASDANRSSDHASVGHPSPIHRRANSKPTGKADDSFIKELLEIARAESQEKQKGTEITFTPALLKNISSNSSTSDKSRTSPDKNCSDKQYDNDTSENKRANSLREDSPFGTLDEPNDIQDYERPKDFKHAISMASTRLTRKKNSKDCSLERELENPTNNETTSNHDNTSLLGDNDNLIHEINHNDTRRNRVLSREDLPYSTVATGRRQSRVNSQDPNTKVSQRAKMFEQVEHNHQHNQKKYSDGKHINSTSSSKMPIYNQCSSSSGIYSGNPDDEYIDQDQPKGSNADFSDNVRNQKQYYDNLINKVKNLNKNKYANNNSPGLPRPTQRTSTENESNSGGASPTRSFSPTKSSTATIHSSNYDDPPDSPSKSGKTTRIVKKKKIIRKIRSSVDKDPTNTDKIITRTRGKSTL